MAVSSYSVTIVDFDGQKGIFAINTVPLTSANFAAQKALLDALRAEISPLIDGDIQAEHINIPTLFLPSNAKSADPEAQRGNKWRIDTYDNTAELAAGVPNPSYFKPFQYELPTANLELRVNSSNVIWTVGGTANDADADEFVADFEAVAKSPNGGALQVTQIVAVTRAVG
jgi:hypothetical protein